MLVSGEPLAAKPSRIVAGSEPEKTNELLQAIAKCCLNKVRVHAHTHTYVRAGTENRHYSIPHCLQFICWFCCQGKRKNTSDATQIEKPLCVIFQVETLYSKLCSYPEENMNCFNWSRRWRVNTCTVSWEELNSSLICGHAGDALCLK